MSTVWDPVTKRCPYCNQEHPADAQYCPNTGQSLPSGIMHCPNCGEEIKPTWKVCTQCGYRVDGLPPTVPIPMVPELEEKKPKRKRRFLFLILLIVGSLLAVLGGIFISGRNLGNKESKSNGVADLWTTSEESSIASYFTDTATSEPPSSNTSEWTATVGHSETPTPRPTSSSTPTSTSTPTQEPTPTLGITNSADSAELIFIPEGEFIMGSDQDTDPYFWGAEGPQHAVYLDDYWIYKTEVTNAMYRECVEEQACPRPEQVISPIADDYYVNQKYNHYPVIYVTYIDAVAYCKWVGGRLPTEAEWEKAARGTDGRLFPWGNEVPTDNFTNLCDKSCAASGERVPEINDGYPGPAPVGSFPEGASPYGVLDMAGNVWEWVFDYFQSTFYNGSPYENPRGPVSGDTRVFRGGSWANGTNGIRVVMRLSLKPGDSTNAIGFRCVVDGP